MDGAVYVDGTFGAGGYSAALLAAAQCRVLGIDRDPAAVRGGAALAAKHPGRLTVIEGRFGDMARLVGEAMPGPVAGITLDLGVSSMQLDSAERGFSFRLDGPLDMRMGDTGTSAADLVAELPEEALAELIRSLGEERFARRVARAIVAARQQGPIRRTGELAAIVRAAIPTREPGLDSATRTQHFQALRGSRSTTSLGELDRGLASAEAGVRCRAEGSPVVPFHSLGRSARVKSVPCGSAAAPPRRPRATLRQAPAAPPPSFGLLTRRPVRPGATNEIARNPRARSARLRPAAERTAAPPWPALAESAERSRSAAGGEAR